MDGIVAILPVIQNSTKSQDACAIPVTSNVTPIATRFFCGLSGDNRGKIAQTDRRTPVAQKKFPNSECQDVSLKVTDISADADRSCGVGGEVKGSSEKREKCGPTD